MQAVILAAGKGTRMGDLTKNTPKPLLKIGNKTILEQTLESLPEEIEEVILVIGYLGEQIKNLIGGSFAGKKVTYVEQKELKGTADAIFECKDLLRGRFLVLMGDDLYNKRDLENLIKSPLAILVSEVKEESLILNAALVRVNAGELAGIVEQGLPRGGTVLNTGAYVLNTDLFKYPMVSAGNPADEFGLPQTFLQMVKDGAKFAVIPAEKWHKIASPEDLKLDN